MKNKDTSYLKYIFLIVSVLLILLGVALVSKHNQHKKYFATTNAVIVDIISDVNVDIYEDEVYSETDYYVYVDYVVDGVEYNYVPLNKYDITMYVGKIITIDYDIRNPLNLEDKNTYFIFAMVSMGVGAVLGAFSLVAIIKKRK